MEKRFCNLPLIVAEILFTFENNTVLIVNRCVSPPLKIIKEKTPS